MCHFNVKTYIISLLFLPTLALAEIPNSIQLAATDWCPYTCASIEKPGIVVEYIREILQPYNISLSVNVLPWNRAIRETDKGKISGLVTAVPSEAPHLAFTSMPTMSYRVCFITRATSTWSYQNPRSLKNHLLGAIRGYSYDEKVDSYIQSNKNEVTLITGEDKIVRFYSMLSSHRLDSFIEDQYVAAWEAKNNNINLEEFKQAGCLSEHPFYLALNPELNWSHELITLLNQQLSLEKNKRLLEAIINKYITND